ncbi:hypothetical protein BC829DRAFT_400681, partial [Chytridium lagenaria]
MQFLSFFVVLAFIASVFASGPTAAPAAPAPAYHAAAPSPSPAAYYQAPPLPLPLLPSTTRLPLLRLPLLLTTAV